MSIVWLFYYITLTSIVRVIYIRFNGTSCGGPTAIGGTIMTIYAIGHQGRKKIDASGIDWGKRAIARIEREQREAAAQDRRNHAGESKEVKEKSISTSLPIEF